MSKALLALVFVLGCGRGWAQEGEWEAERSTAKGFKLKDLHGGTLRSSDLAGKVIVVDFWATWCGPCLKELPDLSSFYQRLKDRADVAFLSFNVTEERDDVLEFVRREKVPYPVYLADDLLGPYEVDAFPTKLIIDMRGKGKGVVRFRRIGYTPIESLEAKLRQVLSREPGAREERP